MGKDKNLDTRALLVALTGIASKLHGGDGDEALYEVLSALGIAVGVDRTYLFDFAPAIEEGNLIASQRAEWVEVGQSRQIANPALQDIDMADAGFADWNRKMIDGEVIATVVSELPSAQREFLGGMQGIVSIVFVPVYSRGRLVGAMGYDDCTTERDWHDEEIEALRIAASIVGVLCYPS